LYIAFYQKFDKEARFFHIFHHISAYFYTLKNKAFSHFRSENALRPVPAGAKRKSSENVDAASLFFWYGVEFFREGAFSARGFILMYEPLRRSPVDGLDGRFICAPGGRFVALRRGGVEFLDVGFYE